MSQHITLYYFPSPQADHSLPFREPALWVDRILFDMGNNAKL
jgi:hypothetical protein